MLFQILASKGFGANKVWRTTGTVHCVGNFEGSWNLAQLPWTAAYHHFCLVKPSKPSRLCPYDTSSDPARCRESSAVGKSMKQIVPIVAALALSILSTFTSSQPQANAVCFLCGDSNLSVDPTFNVTVNETEYPCGELEFYALSGNVTEAECVGATSLVLEFCNCTETDADVLPISSTSGPSLSVSPVASPATGMVPTAGPTASDQPSYSASPVSPDEDETMASPSPVPPIGTSSAAMMPVVLHALGMLLTMVIVL